MRESEHRRQRRRDQRMHRCQALQQCPQQYRQRRGDAERRRHHQRRPAEMIVESGDDDLGEPLRRGPGRAGHREGEDVVMGHCAVRDDPAPGGDVPIGIGIAEHRTGREQQRSIDRDPDDERQRQAKPAAAGRQGRDLRHALRVMLRVVRHSEIAATCFRLRVSRRSAPALLPSLLLMSAGQPVNLTRRAADTVILDRRCNCLCSWRQHGAAARCS